jgi:zinc/manganese transport system substrate-binding protein
VPTTLTRCAGLAIGVALVLAGLGCATTPPAAVEVGPDGGTVLRVVAAENFWGSLASQLGGTHASVTSIIANPDADPHDYEPTVADVRAVAGARVAIINGAGYDAWAGKLVAANPSASRQVLTVGEIVGVPAGGNPHRWYSPTDVRTVIDRITGAYQAADPADAAYFTARHDEVLGTALHGYFALISRMRESFAGTPVGASESILVPLADALGLSLVTPASFLDAISEGADPTSADKTTIDRQIAHHEIKVYVYNSQNATPDIQAQVSAARAAGIPVTTVTETLTPAGATFQDWQVRQLNALEQALGQAAGE